MKKSLFIISLMTLFACNRENETLVTAEDLSKTSKTVSSRSGDIGALIIEFIPNNITCGLGQPILPIDTLPYGAPTGKINITAMYNPLFATINQISLPELIVNYVESQGITIEEAVLENTTPSGSYFENNFFKEYTFSDAKNQLDDDGNPSTEDFAIFSFSNFMEKDYASMVVQNAYQKIISMTISNNTIKGIRIFYEEESCSDNLQDRRNLKIQVIYRLNHATAEPVLEL